MSGRPYPEGVAKLKKELQALQQTCDYKEAARLDIDIAKGRLESLKDQESAILERITKLMDEMDVRSPGNSGYQGRMFALLCHLATTKEELK